MTIRSGAQAIQNQKLRRGQTLCTLFRVVRQAGAGELLFTDHDRAITVDGATYMPIGLGQVSAERRESGLRSGDQDASGPIDGDTITLPDLLGFRYRGATVYQSVVDWRRPHVWHYRSTKRIRQVQFDGSRWVATMEGMGARLQRPAGGRFGGTYSTQCPYRLFHRSTCKADPMIGLQYGPSLSFTSTATSTQSLAQTSATWTVDQWVGYSCVVNVGPARGSEAKVASNTAGAVTLATPLFATPDVGDTFILGRGVAADTVIDSRMSFTMDAADYVEASFADDYWRDGEAEWMTGANAGTVSPIVGYVQSTRAVTLLFPTPFDIEVGDRAIIRAGCDGLRGTCEDKFANVVNFGGTDVYSPGAGAALEQPE